MKPYRPTRQGHFPQVIQEGKFYGEIALGNGTQFNCAMMKTEKGIVVSVLDHGAYIFSGYVHFSYAMEKLRLLEGDAKNVSDLINDQFAFGTTRPRQGKYLQQFCADEKSHLP